MPGVAFDELARRASEELKQGRLEDALRLYRAGVELNPLWDEGWWYVGSIYHEMQQFAEARDAYRRLVELKPAAGAAWALLGVCEYRLGHREEALKYLVKGDALGSPGNGEIARLTAYHIAILLVRSGQFDLAARYLAKLARSEGEGPDVVAACGLMTLQMPLLPPEVPAKDRDLVMATGRAVYSALAGRSAEARQRFETLIAAYPSTPRVHYAFGLFLSLEASQDALPMLRQEVSLFPENWQAHLRIAFDILARGTPAEALPHAREAARLAPEVFATHLALGRALIGVDAVDEGIRELEEAARLDPEVPDVYLALAQGYARAGRTGDVERARAKLAALDVKSRPQLGP
jgi:predicted Zn-dependent protease